MKIGILTFHRAENFGAALQCYALQNFLTKEGHNVKIIDYRCKAIEHQYQILNPAILFSRRNIIVSFRKYYKRLKTYSRRLVKKNKYEEFRNRFLRLTEKITDLNGGLFGFDVIIAGSDQIWRFGLTGNDYSYWLDFPVDKETRKISYAASSEPSDIIYLEKNQEVVKRALKDFYSISVREDSLRQLLCKYTEHPINVVVDPTFLLKKDDYCKIMAKPDKSGFVFVYYLFDSPEAGKVAESLAETNGTEVIEMYAALSNRKDDENHKSILGPQEILGYINNASVIVTTSFHGLALSLIFEKQFWVVEKGANQRLVNLLNFMGLENRLIKNASQLNESRINYEIINQRKDEMINKSVAYLNTGVDCRGVAEGNPGIGGTWHMVLIVSSMLAIRDNGIDVTLYTQEEGLLPQGPHYKYVRNQEQSIYEADKEGCDYIILNYGGFDWPRFDFSKIHSELKIIVWCHNFCSFSDLGIFAKESKIAKIITVSREQMDLYRDHPAFHKTDYIYNCVPFPGRLNETILAHPFNEREHNVVYLASLVPAKSFHVLAEVWKSVLEQVPDANLYVIGSGKTYFKDAQLGRYGIASQDYENRFIPTLLNEQGEIIPSVHFLGNLGDKKYEYLYKSKVGVPNPTGSTETFCISAVEMQYLGCSVTAMSAPGYYDTFFNGIITKRSKKSFARTLIKLLKSEKPVEPYSETVERLQANFTIDSVAQEWENLLNGDIKKRLHPVCPISNKRYRLKWLKELRRKCGLHSFFPPIEFFLERLDIVKNKILGF